MAKITKEATLSKAQLVDGGLKGMKLWYEKTEVRNGREYRDEFPGVHKKAPVPLEIELNFHELGRYLLDICGYKGTKDEMEYLEGECTVTGFTYNNNGFVLSGKLRVFESGKVIALNTPLVSDGNEYDKFPEVCVLLDKTNENIKSYAAGKTVMSDEELLNRVSKQQKMNFDTPLEEMSDKEKKEWATKFLEKAGSLVFHDEDANEEVVEPVIVDQEKPKKKVKEEKAVPVMEAEIIPANKNVTEAVVQENFGDDEEDDFSLEIGLKQ